jgi:hypothetical protein
MFVQVIEEHGYFAAMLGLSLSYNQDVARMPTVAERLKGKGGGHNKFLESIYVWLNVDAPRYWWQQADTYRHSTKQSESTMHTLMRNKLTQDNFEGGLPEEILDMLNSYIVQKDFDSVKKWLPENFLQRRIWVVNYMTLRNICKQRESHKLPEWQLFLNALKEQLDYPELIWEIEDESSI